MTTLLPPGNESAGPPAEAHLSAVDGTLARLIASFGPCPLGPITREPYDALVVAIVGQQLSTKAAAAIRDRLETQLGVKRPFRPDHFLSDSPECLRAAGLSGAKARTVLHLAGAVARGDIAFEALITLPDARVIEALVDRPGIGRWTAEMFLIFGLGRLDVLSLTDSGLRRAARRLYGLAERDDEAFRRLAESWRPYRSVASWYLWRSLDQPS